MNRHIENWSNTNLGSLFENKKERGHNEEELLSVTRENGIIRRDSLERRDTSNKDKGKYLLVDKGDIAYNTMRMWQGVSGVSSYRGIVSPAYTVCSTTEKIDSKFASYLLKDPAMILLFRQRSQGLVSDTWNLKYEKFSQIPCYLPPLVEQKKIAEILSSLDSLITKMESLILKKKIYGENLMNEIIKNDSTQIIYSANELIKNGHILKIKDGNHGSQYPRTHEFSKSGVPFINASSITSEGEIDFNNCPCLPEKRVQTMNIPPAESGDVILTHNATVGKITIIPPAIDKVVVSTSTTFYRLNQKLLNNNYLAAFLKSPIYQTQLLRIMGQTTRNQVPITAQKELKISVPSMLVQEKISSIYNFFSSDLKLQFSKLNKLKLLKQSISNDLLSGIKKITY